MADQLTAELAELTGEELYHLLTALSDARSDARAALAATQAQDDTFYPLIPLHDELVDVFGLVCRQLGRITVPIREAAAVVARAQLSRRHPIRVPGT